MHHTFFVQIFAVLHNYFMKMPNLAFCGERKQATTKLCMFLFRELGYGP